MFPEFGGSCSTDRFLQLICGHNRRMATKTKKTGKKKTVKKKDRPLRTAQRNRLDDEDFAFPEKRKEPIVDARHVRNAIARFDQVEDVTDAERDRAWERIVEAAKKFGVEVSERSWRELFKGGKPSKKKKKATKKKSAKKK
jgi:hypothetical protein